jgi:putative restriction-modification enzyme type I S subunit
MAMETNNTPALRFPGFAEEWEEKTLGEVFKTYSGGTPDTTKKKAYYGGTIPFIRSAEINKEETELFLTQEGLEKSSAKLVNKGDLLVALYGANSGDSAIAKINGAINQAVLCLQSENSNVFVQNFLQHNRELITQKYLQGGQGNLSGEIIKSIRVPFPSSKEQQKIAACLSSLDALITAAQERLDALKAHKKGLLQQLFPREGSNTPELRFAGFTGEWEEKTLGEVLSYIQPTPYIVESTVYDPAGTPVLTAGKTFVLGYTDEADGIFTNLPTIIFDDFTTESRYINFPFKVKSSAIKMLTLKDDNNDLYFLYSLMSTIDFTVSAHKRYWISEFQNLIVSIPSLPEQQKIASCLSSLDTLLEKQQERITLLKTHKKGLLQQLFPNY